VVLWGINSQKLLPTYPYAGGYVVFFFMFRFIGNNQSVLGLFRFLTNGCFPLWFYGESTPKNYCPHTLMPEAMSFFFHVVLFHRKQSINPLLKYGMVCSVSLATTAIISGSMGNRLLTNFAFLPYGRRLCHFLCSIWKEMVGLFLFTINDCFALRCHGSRHHGNSPFYTITPFSPLTTTTTTTTTFTGG
jgi:hypothetical protein